LPKDYIQHETPESMKTSKFLIVLFNAFNLAAAKNPLRLSPGAPPQNAADGPIIFVSGRRGLFPGATWEYSRASNTHIRRELGDVVQTSNCGLGIDVPFNGEEVTSICPSRLIVKGIGRISPKVLIRGRRSVR